MSKIRKTCDAMQSIVSITAQSTGACNTNAALSSLPSGAILVGRRKEEGGQVLLSDHLDLRVLSSEVSAVVKVASDVGCSTWRSSGALRARSRLRPSVGLDDGDTGRDLGIG